jgi:branched-chain amino acid transport system substrate-binding protein
MIVKFLRRLASSGIALLLFGFSLSAMAQQEIRIGVIYPLTGPAASTGAELKNALELATDIINNGAKQIPGLPFSQGGGLPGLKGAKIKLIFADHRSDPQVGASEAERLISEEHVVALIGCYNSNVTQTASQVAERNKIPFLNPESSSASLTTRGFKWFFRTTPHDDLFVRNFFEFLKELKEKKNIDVKRVALMNENTQWGTETSKLENSLSAERGITVGASVIYPAKSTQLTSEVQTLKGGNPQVVMQSSYLGDALLSMKTYKELGFSPDMILANDAGFADTEFVKTLGKDADYIISREVWSLDLANHNPLIKQVNDLYFSRYNVNFTGNSARTFTGLMVMADAINRAGSTDPEAIRHALAATNIAGDKLIMPWKGVKFDESGQNTLGQGILVQIIDGKYLTVWPFELAAHDIVWPMPKWDQRKSQ